MKFVLLLLIFIQKDVISATPDIQNVAENYVVDHFPLFPRIEVGTISKYKNDLFKNNLFKVIFNIQNEYE